MELWFPSQQGDPPPHTPNPQFPRALLSPAVQCLRGFSRLDPDSVCLCLHRLKTGCV